MEKIEVICYDVPGRGILIVTPEQQTAWGGPEGVKENFFRHCPTEVVGQPEQMDKDEFEALENFHDL